MKLRKAMAAAAIAAVIAAPAAADEDAELSVNGQAMVTKVAAPDGHPLDEILSGWRFRTSETQALQTDDFDNPAFIFVDEAVETWETADGKAGKACASCHGDVAESMKSGQLTVDLSYRRMQRDDEWGQLQPFSLAENQPSRAGPKGPPGGGSIDATLTRRAPSSS